jgi:hypothetical protein
VDRQTLEALDSGVVWNARVERPGANWLLRVNGTRHSPVMTVEFVLGNKGLLIVIQITLDLRILDQLIPEFPSVSEQQLEYRVNRPKWSGSTQEIEERGALAQRRINFLRADEPLNEVKVRRVQEEEDCALGRELRRPRCQSLFMCAKSYTLTS